MSKKKIVDVFAIVIIAVFLIAVYLLPQLNQLIMQVLCTLDTLIKQDTCDIGRLVFYMIPFIAVAWLVIRIFGKLLEYL